MVATSLPLDIAEQDRLIAWEHRFFLVPEKWSALTLPTAPKWSVVQLHAKTSRTSIPQGSGVYTILIQPGIADHPSTSYLMYVGQAVNLRKRFGTYLTTEKGSQGRPKIHRLLHKYAEHIWFCYTPVAKIKLDIVEDALIVAYLPPLNDKFPASVSRIVGAFS